VTQNALPRSGSAKISSDGFSRKFAPIAGFFSSLA
jgi:hypothetical protein